MTDAPTYEQTVADVARALGRLESWILRNGWAGYDPFDILGTDWYLRLSRSQSLPGRATHKAAAALIGRFPMAARKATGVKPRINAKAMGLLASAYCVLFDATGERSHLVSAAGCADWLLTNPSEGYAGLSWGYPFDWQSIVFIPAGTPSAVVSTAVGDGLWRLWRATGEKKYLDACTQVGRFLLEGLNRTQVGPDVFCFSYTPIDTYQVHNANLFAAEFLARVGRELRRADWVTTGIRAGTYALWEQNPDGSIFYWGRVQSEYAPDHLDCYHSGFEIRCLWGLWESTGEARFRDAALRYLDFFYRTYLQLDGSVRLFPGRAYPIDVHGCAEALLCPAAMARAAPRRFHETIPNVARRVVETMANPDGSFAYTAYESGRVDRTPYMRWGQAWMLRALAEVQFALRMTAPDTGGESAGRP